VLESLLEKIWKTAFVLRRQQRKISLWETGREQGTDRGTVSAHNEPSLSAFGRAYTMVNKKFLAEIDVSEKFLAAFSGAQRLEMKMS